MTNAQQTPCLALQLYGHMSRPTNRSLRKAATNLSRIERLKARPVSASAKFKSVFSEYAPEDGRAAARRFRHSSH